MKTTFVLDEVNIVHGSILGCYVYLAHRCVLTCHCRVSAGGSRGRRVAVGNPPLPPPFLAALPPYTVAGGRKHTFLPHMSPARQKQRSVNAGRSSGLTANKCKYLVKASQRSLGRRPHIWQERQPPTQLEAT